MRRGASSARAGRRRRSAQLTVDSLADRRSPRGRRPRPSKGDGARRVRRSPPGARATACSRTRCSPARRPTAAGALAAEPPDARHGYVVLGYDLAPIEWFAAAAAEQKADGVDARRALHRRRRRAVRADRHRARDLPGPLDLAADQAARVEGRSDRARRPRGPRRGHVAATRSACSARTSTSWPTRSSILLQQTAEKATHRAGARGRHGRSRRRWSRPPIRSTTARSRSPASIQPAAQTGGDWWTWSELVGGKILVVIGDVTGHGVPSAMITAAAKAACDVARYVHQRRRHGDARCSRS